jgi:8-oxo-dGTP diphosphatase
MEATKVRIQVKAFVFNDADEVLVLRRSGSDPRRPLSWDLPGGNVELGEDPTEAVARELREETGLTIEDLKVSSVSSSNGEEYVVSLWFAAKAGDAEVKLSAEHDQYRWVARAEFGSWTYRRSTGGRWQRWTGAGSDRFLFVILVGQRIIKIWMRSPR